MRLLLLSSWTALSRSIPCARPQWVSSLLWRNILTAIVAAGGCYRKGSFDESPTQMVIIAIGSPPRLSATCAVKIHTENDGQKTHPWCRAWAGWSKLQRRLTRTSEYRTERGRVGGEGRKNINGRTYRQMTTLPHISLNSSQLAADFLYQGVWWGSPINDI